MLNINLLYKGTDAPYYMRDIQLKKSSTKKKPHLQLED